jgi:Cft2 family RNA processing exonuclease
MIIVHIIIITGGKLMAKTIVKWLVEEVDAETKQTLFSVEFTDHKEALDTFNHLKEVSDKNLISIHKNEKRLLVE